nr:hypothetical protein [Shewanella baltica]
MAGSSSRYSPISVTHTGAVCSASQGASACQQFCASASSTILCSANCNRAPRNTMRPSWHSVSSTLLANSGGKAL